MNSSANSHDVGQDPADQLDQGLVEAALAAKVVGEPKAHAEEGSRKRKSKNKNQGKTLAFVTPVAEKGCRSSDSKDLHATQGEDLKIARESREPLTPVVQKLVRKHGGSMELGSLMGAINKKKKRRLGLTGNISISKVQSTIHQVLNYSYRQS